MTFNVTSSCEEYVIEMRGTAEEAGRPKVTLHVLKLLPVTWL